MLHSINQLREHQSAHSPSGTVGGGAIITMATTPIYHTLALLHTVLGDHDKVISCFYNIEIRWYTKNSFESIKLVGWTIRSLQ